MLTKRSEGKFWIEETVKVLVAKIWIIQGKFTQNWIINCRREGSNGRFAEWRYEGNFSFHLCLPNGRSSICEKGSAASYNLSRLNPNNLILKWRAVWWRNFPDFLSSRRRFSNEKGKRKNRISLTGRSEEGKKTNMAATASERNSWKENVCGEKVGKRKKIFDIKETFSLPICERLGEWATVCVCVCVELRRWIMFWCQERKRKTFCI